MSQYEEMARTLREDPDVHYSCSQSVLMPFAEGAGLDRETARKVAANFNAGMKMGSVCGAMTGGLMVLGLYGISDPGTVQEYLRGFKQDHDGLMDCRDLLRASAARGEVKKVHCDGMVYEAVRRVEKILDEAGVLPAAAD